MLLRWGGEGGVENRVTALKVGGGGHRGSTVVKVLCYKSESRLFDPSWCHWNFSLI